MAYKFDNSAFAGILDPDEPEKAERPSWLNEDEFANILEPKKAKPKSSPKQSPWGGLLREGNIDLARRPSVENPETGGTSTVWSAGFGTDDGEVLLPRVTDDGRILSEKQAFEEYRRTGKHLGIFKTPDDASRYADALHKEQERMGKQWGKDTYKGDPRFMAEPETERDRTKKAKPKSGRTAETSEEAFDRRLKEEALARQQRMDATLAGINTTDNRPQNIIPNAGAALLSGAGTALGGLFGSMLGSDEDSEDTTAIEVSNAAATAGQSLRSTTEEIFPQPQGIRRLEARQQDSQGLGEYAQTFLQEPVGTAQMIVQQLAQSAPAMAVAGPIGGSAAIESLLGSNQAADQFDNEWKQGIIQQSDVFQQMAATQGEEAARQYLRNKRIVDTQAVSGAVGAATAGIAGKLGANPVEQVLGGAVPAKTLGAKAVAKELLVEPLEEVAVQIPQNLIAANTGSDTTWDEGVGEAAIAGAVMGPGQATILSAPGKVSDGMQAARAKLADLRGFSGGKPDPTAETKPIKIDPEINKALEEQQKAEAAKEQKAPDDLSTSIKAEAESIIPPVAPAVKPKFRQNAEGVWEQVPPATLDAAVAQTSTPPVTNAQQVPTTNETTEQAPVAVTAPIVAPSVTPSATLPKELAGAKPRYGYDSKNFELVFESDLDRASFIVSQKNPSKKDAEYLQFVMDNTGLDEAGARARGLEVRARIKEQARTTEAGQDGKLPPLRVPVTPVEASTTPPATLVPAPAVEAATAPPAKPARPSKTDPSNRAMTKVGAENVAINMVLGRAKSDPAFAEQVKRNPVLVKVETDRVAGELQKLPAERNLGEYPNVQKAKVQKAQAPAVGEQTQTERQATQEGALDTQADATPPNPGGRSISDIVSSAPNVRAMLINVATGRVAGDPVLQEIAASLKDSPNATADIVVEVIPGDPRVAGHPLHRVKADGTTSWARATYDPNNGGKVLLSEEAGAVDILHEIQHAVAVKAASAIESGLDTDPDRVQALQDLKDATAQIADVDTSSMDKRTAHYVKYAATNPLEAMAVARSDPKVAEALNNIPFKPRPGQPKGKIATLLDAIIDFTRRIMRMPARLPNSLKSTNEALKENMLGNKIIAAAKVLEAKDARGIKGKDIKEGYNRLKKGSPATNDTRAPTVTKVPEKGEGRKRVGNRIKEELYAEGSADKETQVELLEKQRGLEQRMLYEAETAVRRVNNIMAKVVSSTRGATREMYNVEMVKYLQGDKGANLPANLKQAIDAVRNLIDARSLELISLGAVSKAERKKIINNLGKWTHRDYKVFHLTPGRATTPGEWANIVSALADRGIRDIVGDALPGIMSELALPPANILDQLAAQASNKNKDQQSRKDARDILETYAKQWDIAETKHAEIADRLKGVEALGIDRLREQAIKYGHELLDPQRASVFNKAEWKGDTSRLNIDDSALDQKRKKVPEWLQTLWGKYDDFDAISLLSLSNQGRIIAKFKALADFKAIGEKAGIIFKNEKLSDKTTHPGYTLLHDPNSKLTYGPLDGYWIKDSSAALIQGVATLTAAESFLQKTALPEALKVLSGPGSVWKKMAVIASHSTALVNMGTSALILSGPVGWTSLFTGVKIARASSLGGVSFIGGEVEVGSQIDADLKVMIENNLLQDAALSADMKRDMIQTIRNSTEKLLSSPKRTAHMLKRGYNWGVDRGGRINSFGDETAKVMKAYSNLFFLNKIYPQNTREQNLKQAIRMATETMPSWIKAMPFSKKAANSGIGMMFLPFHTEMLRNIKNQAKDVAKFGAMSEPWAKAFAAHEAAHMAIKVAGVYGLHGAAAYGAYLLSQAFGDDEEDKQAEEGFKMNDPKNKRAFAVIVPEYVTGDIVVSRMVDEDTLTYFSTQRFDVLPAGAMFTAIENGQPEKILTVLGDTYGGVAPLLIPGLKGVASFAEWVTSGEDDLARMNAEAGMAKSYSDIEYAMVPGSVKTLMRPSASEEKGVPLSTAEKIVTNAGGTVVVLDMKKAIGQVGANYSMALNAQTSAQSRDASSENWYEGAGLATDVSFEGWVGTKLGMWTKAREKVEAYQQLGKDSNWIFDNIKENPASKSLSDDEIYGLIEGEFPMPDFDTWLYDKEEAEYNNPKNSKIQDKITEKYARYRAQYEGIQDDLEKLVTSKGIKVQ